MLLDRHDAWPLPASCELWPHGGDAATAAVPDPSTPPALRFMVRIFLSKAAKLTPQGPAALARGDAQYTTALPFMYAEDAVRSVPHSEPGATELPVDLSKCVLALNCAAFALPVT